MSDNSLFAILLRRPWWISLAIGAGLGLAGVALLPAEYRVFGAVTGFPFLVIAAIAFAKQLRAPSQASIARTLDATRAMAWAEFSQALEDAYRRDGYEVTRLAGRAADFELAKAGRRTLVSCKRWKVARTGVEPLRELRAAMEARDAQACVYVAVGEVSDNARRYAAEQRIGLIGGVELAQLGVARKP